MKDLKRESSDYTSKAEVEHQTHSEAIPSVHGASASDDGLRQRHDASAKLANPLAGLSQDALARMADEYCSEFGFTDQEDIRVFRLGAKIAGNDFQYDTIEGLTELEKEALWKEVNHKWRANPSKLYGVIIVCVSIYPPYITKLSLFLNVPANTCGLQALCAAVQGMDETVVNGAQTFYKVAFGIGDPDSSRDSWLVGLVNSAPYLCCAFIGCWLTEPMNKRFGRRGTVWISCLISALACLWQGFTSRIHSCSISCMAMKMTDSGDF